MLHVASTQSNYFLSDYHLERKLPARWGDDEYTHLTSALATQALLLDEDDFADSLRGLICLAATKRYLVEAQ
jgi:hypothetical protein